MNARTLSQHYGLLTGEERLRLMLAAQARGDHAEIVSLWTSCPKMEVIAPDPNFLRLVYGMQVEVHSLVLQWVEVSHSVVADGQGFDRVGRHDPTAKTPDGGFGS